MLDRTGNLGRTVLDITGVRRMSGTLISERVSRAGKSGAFSCALISRIELSHIMSIPIRALSHHHANFTICRVTGHSPVNPIRWTSRLRCTRSPSPRADAESDPLLLSTVNWSCWEDAVTMYSTERNRYLQVSCSGRDGVQ